MPPGLLSRRGTASRPPASLGPDSRGTGRNPRRAPPSWWIASDSSRSSGSRRISASLRVGVAAESLAQVAGQALSQQIAVGVALVALTASVLSTCEVTPRRTCSDQPEHQVGKGSLVQLVATGAMLETCG
ncbi:hypothetical protein Ae717Ps2_6760c [Pseudonocardia sp. Ae717_Ps2]|nr:hypothetical protein Ae717Ps2_6760c [Pseudonocardia sp. Ae717_Ps2]